MSIPLKSQDDLYQLFIDILQDHAPQLTDLLDGSIIDGLAGVFSIAGMELQRRTVLEFNKTYLDLANGPEITGADDEIQTLVVDHFGQAFARPLAIQAIDTVTFTRPSGSVATYGAISIPVGTIVKTAPDANGTAQRYSTNAPLTMTNVSAGSDTSVAVAVTAVVAGAAGDAAEGTINIIESSLLDPTIVCTNAGNQTGADAPDDSAYREIVRNLIEAIAGATIKAITAKALTVTGVVTATPIESAITCIQYNIGSSSTVGSPFSVVQATLYVADGTGSASPALLAAVRLALQGVRACGVNIIVASATGQSVNWTGSYTLNPEGPNYAVFVNDPSAIIEAMTNYINGLPVGTGFVRATANAAILAIYGSGGTNDLTVFTTSAPSGDIAGETTNKLVAGTVTTI